MSTTTTPVQTPTKKQEEDPKTPIATPSPVPRQLFNTPPPKQLRPFKGEREIA